MSAIELRRVWSVDFNNTLAIDPRIDFQHPDTISCRPLGQDDLELLGYDLPQMKPWERIRPVNPGSKEIRDLSPRSVLDNIGRLAGLADSPYYRYGPMLAWMRLAPYLELDEKTLEEIGRFYERQEISIEHEEHFTQRAKALVLRSLHKKTHIDPYRERVEERIAMAKRTEDGDQFTVITALQEANEADLIDHLDQKKDDPLLPPTTWEIIQKFNPPIFMRAGASADNDNIMLYKCMAYALRDQYVKALNKQAKEKGERVGYIHAGYDDDVCFGLHAMALFDDLEMHLPSLVGESRVREAFERIRRGEYQMLPQLYQKLEAKAPLAFNRDISLS